MRERRWANRFSCDRAVYYHNGAAGTIGTVHDVSLSGLRLDRSGPLRPGDHVRMVSLTPRDIASGREILGSVQWCSHNGSMQAGLVFTQSVAELCDSWVGGLLRRREAQRERLLRRRCNVRVDLPFLAHVKEGDGPYHTVEVTDLSADGVRVLTRNPFNQGSQATFHMVCRREEIELPARLVRCGEGWAALHLQRSDKRLEELIAEYLRREAARSHDTRMSHESELALA